MKHYFQILAIGVIALMPLTTVAQNSTSDAQELPREEIEEIVREYLLREPEVIYEAIQEFQRRQQIADAERQQELLTSRAGDIFEDTRDPVANADGDIVVVEFFDYRCGYCRSMTDGLEALLGEDQKMRFVFKEFPILGEDSMRAARAALAAHKQGGYDAMHFALMRARDLSLGGIQELAIEQGLDADQLTVDMDSEEVAAHIRDNIELARSLGINGTPSFIVEDELIPGAVPVEQLGSMVAERRDQG